MGQRSCLGKLMAAAERMRRAKRSSGEPLMLMHDHLAAAAAVIVKAGQLAVPGDQIVPSNRCSPMLPSHLEEARN